MADPRIASPGRRVHPWYRWAVILYDRAYRVVHGLDRPPAAGAARPRRRPARGRARLLRDHHLPPRSGPPRLSPRARRHRLARAHGRLPARADGLAPSRRPTAAEARDFRRGAAALDDPRG